MEVWELVIIAIVLATDAFAVSVCKGLATKEGYIKTGLLCGAWFGFFQALMPLLGWLLGYTVAAYIESVAPYVAFILLAFLGIKMIVEAIGEMREQRRGDAEGICICCADKRHASLGFSVMLTFAIATSIDALAAGLTFSAMNAPILLAIGLIGVITFLTSFIGATLGAKIGSRWGSRASLAGGVVLLAIGVKILIEGFLK